MKLSKKKTWLVCLLPLLFLADIIYGGLDYYGISLFVGPGIVLRGIALLFAFYVFFRKLSFVNKKLKIIVVLSILLVFPSFISGLLQGQSFFYDIIFSTKIVYLPLITALFVVIRQRYELTNLYIIRYIEYSAYVLGVSLLLSQLLGIQHDSYGDYAFGNTGIFYAQNDMTLAFGLALLASGYSLALDEFSLVRSVLFVFSGFACIQIGTRASLAVVFGTAITVAFCVLWGRPIKKNSIDKLKKAAIVIFILISMGGGLAYGLTRQQEFGFQQKKLEELASGEFPRLALVLSAVKHISGRSLAFDFFGEGADAFHRGVAKYFPGNVEHRIVEVDWMDILGAYGIFYTLFIYLFLMYIFLFSVTRFLIKREQIFGLVSAATLLYLGHSVLAGHALISPIPTTLMSGYFSIFFERKKYV